MPRVLLIAALMAACRPATWTVEAADFTVEIERKTGLIHIAHPSGARLDALRLLHGSGAAEIEMQFGAWSFRDVTRTLDSAASVAPLRGRKRNPPYFIEFEDVDGAPAGSLVVQPAGDILAVDYTPPPGANRVGFSADCDADDHFLGFGGHAMDVDHVGQAFPLWVGEPGIGKTLDEEEPDDFPIRGTRHDASYPAPFALRPHHADGVWFDTYGRVDVDLCHSDPSRWEMVAWDDRAPLRFIAGGSPTGTVQALTSLTGRLTLPPPWVFGAWGDAIRGRERVESVATTLREIGAAVTVIWSEDWKGAVETPTGFRLRGEWFLDEALYPDASEMTRSLSDQGFKWFGYFSPFLDVGDETYEDALANDAVVKNAAGEPYVFTGVRFQQTTLVDLSTVQGRSWAAGYLTDALDLGIAGWMTDYAEWLPADAVLNNGQLGLDAHNQYPEWWQLAHAEATAGRDATFFARSGWSRSTGLAPIIWAGDQRTDFQRDDGFPTVITMGLGYAASGVPVYTHDVAGYQSLTNPPTTKELWFRWAGLGAYSPVYRLHHGSQTDANHQWDSDADTLAHYASTTREHMRLWPYRYGLAKRAADTGVPMIQPVAFVHGGEDWARDDAWMLGDALLVAPVLEPGVDAREVSLPSRVSWWTWPDLRPATSGPVDAPIEVTPVFAAGGTTVPTFATIPDTLLPNVAPGLLTLADVDDERVVYLLDGGGTFTEGDGTRYEPRGRPTGPGEATATLRSGQVDVMGVRVDVDGPTTRTYRFVVP